MSCRHTRHTKAQHQLQETPDYRRGATDFKALLVQLDTLNLQNQDQSGKFDPYSLARILRAGCLAPMSKEQAEGFWNALTLVFMVGAEVITAEFDPEEWDPLENLAIIGPRLAGDV